MANGLFSWLFFGWWFRMRLRLSGARRPEPRPARLVWLYAHLPFSALLVGEVMVGMLQHRNYITALREDFPLLSVGLLFWGNFIAYRGVVACFEVKRSHARWWFLILPTALLVTILVVLLVLVVTS
jgi:hypothetical protein